MTKVKPISGTNLVRKDFFRYLKTDFLENKDWEHPTTGEVFTHKQILGFLEKYKDLNPSYYNALYSTWVGLSQQDVADRYLISQSTLKRRWQKAASHLLLLMIFPKLTPDDLCIYTDRV